MTAAAAQVAARRQCLAQTPPQHHAWDPRDESPAEDATWERQNGGTDHDSDKACDEYERWLDRPWGDAS